MLSLNYSENAGVNNETIFRYSIFRCFIRRYRHHNLHNHRTVIMEIDYIYIDENGLTVTRLKPQKTVEEYRAHTGGLFDDDTLESIEDLTGE